MTTNAAVRACPRCSATLVNGTWEPTCLQCGYHDWSQTDDNRARFTNNGNLSVDQEESPTTLDRGEAHHQKSVTQRIWRWQFHYGGKRNRRTGSVAVIYVVHKVGSRLVRDWPAAVMEIRGNWPWSPGNSHPQQDLRQAFRAETGRELQGLKDAIQDKYDGAVTREM